MKLVYENNCYSPIDAALHAEELRAVKAYKKVVVRDTYVRGYIQEKKAKLPPANEKTQWAR